MNKIIKVLIAIMCGVVVIGGLWYIAKKARAPEDIEINKSGRTAETDQNQEITDTSSQSEKSSDTSPSSSRSTDLQKQANQILDMPIIAKQQLGEPNKNQIAQKINELSIQLRQNYDQEAPWLDMSAYRQMLGDYQGAVATLNFVTLIRPNRYVAFHNLGALYGFYIHDYPKSEQNFLKAIALYPQDIDGYSQLVTVYQDGYREKEMQIEPLLKKGISINPKEPALMILLGRYYARHNNTIEAIKYLGDALALTPNNTALKSEIESLQRK